uniref:Ig-like domain-containing protein n=1 Tax=Monodon monoceros TaxID=40151 RepID=A0A8C6AV09_MONMO
ISCPIVAHDCSLTFPSLSLLVGLTFQAEVIQETSLTTVAGEKVTVICGSSAGVVTTSNYADWVQRKPHQGRLIGGSSTRVPGVPAQFSGSLLGDKAALTISEAQSKDKAEYYCVLWISNHFHRNGQVKILFWCRQA